MPLLRTLLPAVLLGLLVAAAPARASSGQVSLFEAPRELLSDDAALRTETLDQVQGFGVHWVRLVLYWRNVAPESGSGTVPSFDETDPAAYPGFGRYDRAVDEIRARGMKVLLTVSGPVPKWATSTRRDYLTKPSVTRWERFMTAVGRHYQASVNAWSVWNEPNHPGFLLPQYSRSGRPYSPSLYRRLFLAADRALNATGNGQDLLLMGETEPVGSRRAVSPIAFLRGSLCLSASWQKSARCGLLPADGYAHHAYTTSAGPSVRPRNPENVTIGVLPRLTRALDLAGRAHAIRRGMSLYLTEFGIQSYPDPFIGVSLTRQAEYRSIAERIAYRNRRVRMFSQYLMRDDDPRPGSRYARYSGFESGLRRSSGQPKPAYEGYRLPLVVHRTSRTRVYLWGLVRPHAGAASVRVEIRRSGSRTWRRLLAATTNANGYWSRSVRYRAHTWYRVVWTGQTGDVHRGPATRTY
jgi:hypothetical protein